MALSLTDRLSQVTIESGLIAALQNADQVLRVQAAGLQVEDFLVYRTVYEFAIAHLAQYQVAPSRDQLVLRYAEWNPPAGDFHYWLDEMVRRNLAYRAELVIRDCLPQLEQQPEHAIRNLVAKLSDIGIRKTDQLEATDATIAHRLERFVYRSDIYRQQKGAHVWGIQSGLRIIDSTHQGWMPGELVGFYARPTVGKTWMLIRAGAVAWVNPNNRVLLISAEMPANQIALRVDAMLAGVMNMPFSHSRVYAGDPTVMEAYTGLAKVVAQHERWWTVDSVDDRPPTVTDIKMLYRMLKPSLILIDGISLLRDEQRGVAGWEQMKNICYDLKAFATAAEVAIMVSHQAVNTRRGQRSQVDFALGRGDDWVMPSLNDAAYGDSFVQACSTIFTMCPDREEPRLRWYSIRKSRERDIQWVPRMGLAWDVDRGRIIDLGEPGDPLTLQRELQAALA